MNGKTNDLSFGRSGAMIRPHRKNAAMRCSTIRRQRGLTSTEVVVIFAAALLIGLIIILSSGPPSDGKPRGIMSDTAVFMMGSMPLYEQAQTNVRAYLDMLNTSGQMAESVGTTGAVTGPIDGKSVGELLNVSSDMP
jgi:hypothetical protein